ncbi:hypothetical protein GMJAKD_03745 [Candidatus Electrothrix aarhusensis]
MKGIERFEGGIDCGGYVDRIVLDEDEDLGVVFRGMGKSDQYKTVINVWDGNGGAGCYVGEGG